MYVVKNYLKLNHRTRWHAMNIKKSDRLFHVDSRGKVSLQFVDCTKILCDKLYFYCLLQT